MRIEGVCIVMGAKTCGAADPVLYLYIVAAKRSRIMGGCASLVAQAPRIAVRYVLGILSPSQVSQNRIIGQKMYMGKKQPFTKCNRFDIIKMEINRLLLLLRKN